MEYTLVSGSQTGLLALRLFTRPFDWFYDCFSTCFTEFSTGFTEFSTCFTEFSTEMTSN